MPADCARQKSIGPHEAETDDKGANLFDQGSTNGTFVNGKPVPQVDLKNGDIIVAGMTVFTVRVSYVEERAINH